MRTSLNEIQEIEGFLLKTNSNEDRLLQEARTCLDVDFAEKVSFQKEAYEQIRSYARIQLREEIKSVEKRLFSTTEQTGFRAKILRIFKR